MDWSPDKFRVKVELPMIIFRLSMVQVSRIFMDYGMAGHWHFFQNHPELQAEQDIGKSCGKNDEVEDMGFEWDSSGPIVAEDDSEAQYQPDFGCRLV